MTFRSTHITKIFWHIDQMTGLKSEDCILVSGSGQPVNMMEWTQRANEELVTLTSDYGVGTYTNNIKFQVVDVFVLENSTGLKAAVDQTIAMIEFEIRDEFAPFHHFKYSNKGTGTELAKVSVAKGSVGNKVLNIVLHAGPDGRVSLSLFAEEDKD